VETASLGGGRRKLVDDVRSWCAVGSPEARLPAADSELATFWLRKGLQGGLAAVLVDDGRGDPAVFRGMNLEVSLPTGMLCAERNAIGSALAQKPSLRRRDLRAVAILGVRVGEQDSLRDPNPLYPRGACMEWLRKVAEENPDFEMITFNDWTMAECFVQRVAAL
jgi:cytidine deaminase